MPIDPKCLDLAMEIAFPQLRERRRESGHLPAEIRESSVFMADTVFMEGAARTRVRRVVAALNGIDVEREAAAWTEPPALVSRDLARRLVAAVCNARVVAALEAEVGEMEAAVLIGEVGTL